MILLKLIAQEDGFDLEIISYSLGTTQALNYVIRRRPGATQSRSWPTDLKHLRETYIIDL